MIETRSRDITVKLYDDDQLGSLVGFAIANQTHAAGMQQNDVARATGLQDAAISNLIGWKRLPSSPETTRASLVKIQNALILARGNYAHHSLAVLYGQLVMPLSSDVHVPGRYAEDLFRDPPRSPAETFVQASAALALLQPRHTALRSFAVPDGLIESLVVVTGLPPRYGTEAIELLALLARHDGHFDRVLDAIRRALRSSPTGFRCWRVVSLLLRDHVAQGRVSRGDDARLDAAVQTLFHYVDNNLNANPSRSLDIEAAATTPARWTWATNYLRDQVLDPTRTPRQRAYAAIAHWNRTRHVASLREFIDSMANEAPENHLGWARRHLEMMYADRDVARHVLPPGAERRLVGEAAAAASRSTQVKPQCARATEFLIEHALLANDGVARRRALDTLRTAALGQAVTDTLTWLIGVPDTPPWIVERASFALGFVGHQSARAEQALQRVLKASSPHDDTWWAAAEAAAWSIGDIWAHDAPALPVAHEVESLIETLKTLVHTHNVHEPRASRVTRGAAYALSLVGPPSLSPYLRTLKLRDAVAQRLALWGAVRYGEGGRLMDFPYVVTLDA